MTRDEIRLKYNLEFERDISIAKKVVDDFENRTCDGCKHKDENEIMDYSCFECSRYYEDKFEGKQK